MPWIFRLHSSFLILHLEVSVHSTYTRVTWKILCISLAWCPQMERWGWRCRTASSSSDESRRWDRWRDSHSMGIWNSIIRHALSFHSSLFVQTLFMFSVFFLFHLAFQLRNLMKDNAGVVHHASDCTFRSVHTKIRKMSFLQVFCVFQPRKNNQSIPGHPFSIALPRLRAYFTSLFGRCVFNPRGQWQMRERAARNEGTLLVSPCLSPALHHERPPL